MVKEIKKLKKCQNGSEVQTVNVSLHVRQKLSDFAFQCDFKFQFWLKKPLLQLWSKVRYNHVANIQNFSINERSFKEFIKVTSLKNLNYKSQRWKNLDLFVGSVNGSSTMTMLSNTCLWRHNHS